MLKFWKGKALPNSSILLWRWTFLLTMTLIFLSLSWFVSFRASISAFAAFSWSRTSSNFFSKWFSETGTFMAAGHSKMSKALVPVTRPEAVDWHAPAIPDEEYIMELVGLYSSQIQILLNMNKYSNHILLLPHFMSVVLLFLLFLYRKQFRPYNRI